MQIVINIAIFLVSAIIFTFVGMAIRKKVAESKLGSAEEEARKIINLAQKEAENKKKEEIFKAKEEIMNSRKDLDNEIRERRSEVQQQERRLLQKEENLENKMEHIERKEQEIENKKQELENKKQEISKTLDKQMQELQRISGLSKEEAKNQLLSDMDKQLTLEKAILIKAAENKVKEESIKNAREVIGYAIQKCAADHTAETTVSIVPLPNDEMKGRIIGREGRNIKAIETLTGVDLIIDDTPEAVILSSFDPVRREVARISLEKLIVDGRIHPARIEEMVEKAQNEVEQTMREEGEAALLEVGVHGIRPELVRLLGKMKYRTSYGQNALKHSIEVAQLSGLLAGEIGEDVRLAKRAGLLHDIGKAVDQEMEGSHISIGGDLCKKYKESPVVINAVESHHGDVEPTSLIA